MTNILRVRGIVFHHRQGTVYTRVRLPVGLSEVRNQIRWQRVASCVASSAPKQAQESRAVTKLNGLKTNTMGNINQIPKP
jgi:hypothetical protein